MQFQYRVHSASIDDVALEIEQGGQKITAKVPALVIEIVSEDGLNSHTLRKIGASEEDVAGYVAGAVVNGNFELE